MKENIRTWIPPTAAGTQHLKDDDEIFFLLMFMFMSVFVVMVNMIVAMKMLKVKGK